MNRKEIDYAMEMLERGFIPLVRERSELQRVLEQEQGDTVKTPSGRITELTKHVYDDSKSPVVYSINVVWFEGKCPFTNETITNEFSGFDSLRDIEIVDYVRAYQDSLQLSLFS